MRRGLVWDTQTLVDRSAFRPFLDEVSVALLDVFHDTPHFAAFQNSITHRPCQNSKNVLPTSERNPTTQMDDLVQRRMVVPLRLVPFGHAQRHITTIILNTITKNQLNWTGDRRYNHTLLAQNIIIMFQRMPFCL